MIVYLGLGTNLGDRQANLRRALDQLATLGTLRAISPVYQTAALYVTDQPPFLNLVAMLATELEPLALLTKTRQIESELGRDLSPDAQRYGPRPIDIDLLLAARVPAPQVPEDWIDLTTPELILPHPRLAERAFVLVPLRDLAPDLVHPLLGKPIRELAEAVAGQEIQPFNIELPATGSASDDPC